MQQGLGLWLGVTDPRNHVYSEPLTAMRSVLHTDHAPIANQGDTGACTGFTGLDLINTARFSAVRRRVNGDLGYLHNEIGFSFYHQNTVADEWPETWPPTDTGSSVLAMAKVLKKLGYLSQYAWADSFDSMLQALSKGPVMLGTLWTTGMSDPDSSGLIRPTGDLAGGHAYIARGKDYLHRRIRCRNHWTKNWGVRGEFYVGFDDIKWLLAPEQQGECVVPVSA